MPRKSNIGFGGRPIEKSNDVLAAEERIAALAVAPEGSDEEAERVGLIDAVNAYRMKQPGTEDMQSPISSLEQYEEATQRVAELASYAEGTPEAEELHRLIDDIRAWEEARDRGNERGGASQTRSKQGQP